MRIDEDNKKWGRIKWEVKRQYETKEIRSSMMKT